MNQRLLTYALWGGLLIAGMANAQTCTNTAIEESAASSGFTFSSDGKTAAHTATGLVWKRCLEGQTFSDNGTPTNYLDDRCVGSATTMNWQAALTQAQTANGTNDGGYNNWRVPNHKELKSIVEHCRMNPAINMEVFPGSPSSWVWSSSPVVNNPNSASDAWGVYFYYGFDDWFNRSSARHVRLVRSGQ